MRYNSRMRIRIAHVWDEYLVNSFVEVHPLLKKHGFDTDSITLARTVWDNGEVSDGTVFAQRRLPLDDLLHQGFFSRVVAYLERRYFTHDFICFSRSVLRGHQSELVHFHFGFTAAQYPSLPDGRPFLVTFYGSDVSSALRSSFWTKRYKKVLPAAAGLLVLCEAAKSRLVALGCASERVYVWNLPAGVEKYPYAPPRLASGPPRILMTARFVEKKGHGLLLDALALLAQAGEDFSVTLLGYGSGKRAVENGIASRGLAGKVKVIDTAGRGDFAVLHLSVIREHDFFVLPSIEAANGDDEGGPALTMVCAQAAGLPVVCTKFPGAEITMREGETGFYVPEATPAALAAKIRELAMARDQWTRMGLAGSKLAFANFGEKEQVRKLVEIYGEVLGRK